jgi:cytochrome c-type biogenesis protein CcmH/NrfF
MKPKNKKPIAWSLWIPVILAFLLVIGAWFTIIKIAKEHPTERIPVERPKDVE